MSQEAKLNENWANFLANEKLTDVRVPTDKLDSLIRLLVLKKRGPKTKPHAAKLETRKYVCAIAMESGIDIAGWKHNGKLAMGRGLLDAWNSEYQRKFGTTFGTSGAKETVRRDVKTKLSKNTDN